MTDIVHEAHIEDNGDVAGRVVIGGKGLKYSITADAIAAAETQGFDILAEVSAAMEREAAIEIDKT